MSGYNSRKRRTPSVRSGGTSTPTTSSGRGVLPGSGSNNTVPTLGTRQPNINPTTGKPMNNPGFEELLGQFGGTSDLANSLLQLGVGDPSHFMLSGSDATTWNQQLLTILIQYLLTQEQRNYNEQLLNEGRIYDNPQNQLARLMGAGISRDAALQLLSGAGGSGSGGSLPYGEAASAPSMSDFAAVKSADTQAFLGTWNASMSTFSTVMDMVGFGFSVPQAIEQVQALQMQNYMSREQIDAYKSSKMVTGVAQNLLNSGAISYDDVQNATDLEQFMNNNKDNPNIKPLFDSGAFSGAFGTPFGREILNKHWQQLRDSAHGGDVYGEYVKQQRLNSAILGMQPQKISAELALIGTQQKVNEQSIIESCTRIAVGEAQIEVLNEQGKWYAVQSSKTTAEEAFVRAQTEGQQTTNKQLSLNYELNSAGFPMLKQNRIDELTAQALRWNLWLRVGKDTNGKDTKVGPEENPTLYQMQRAWLMNPENAADAAYALSCYYGAVGSFATDYPSLYNLGVALDGCGLGNILRVGSQAVQAGSLFLFP